RSYGDWSSDVCSSDLGIGHGPSFNLGTQNNTTPFPGGVPVAFGWIFGDQHIDVKDTETWAKIDSDFKLNDAGWTDLKFGARFERSEERRVGKECRAVV